MNIRESASTVILVVSGILCLVASALSFFTFSYGYDPRSRDIMLALYWGKGLFIFPFFLIGLLRSKWSVLPLWLLCLTLVVLPLSIPANMSFALGIRNGPIGIQELKEAISVLLMPSLVQLAHALRSPKKDAAST